MSDCTVANLLRSPLRIVAIEAPAGCGKTHQASEFAADSARLLEHARVLVLTHTNAACDVFASRTSEIAARVDVRTLDSFIIEIAGAYHSVLDLPSDVAQWARRGGGRYADVASRVRVLLEHAPGLVSMLATRFPVVICDEHQDASDDQNQIVFQLARYGARLRIFGDPVQNIYGSDARNVWHSACRGADAVDALSEPHRWRTAGSGLGPWILAAREAVRRDHHVSLSEHPDSVSIVFGDNIAKGYGQLRYPPEVCRALTHAIQSHANVLLLTAHNATARPLRALTRLPIWEGHVREGLATLVDQIQKHQGDAGELTAAMLTFLKNVTTGFTKSSYGGILAREVAERCSKNRSGKPALLQQIARLVLDEPDHRGVAKALHGIRTLMTSEDAFRAIRLDHMREFSEAIRLVEFDDPEAGFAELARRRSVTRAELPKKAISTIHKAKGHECSHVIIAPCDATHLNSEDGGRRLYVALSRATTGITMVVPRTGRTKWIGGLRTS